MSDWVDVAALADLPPGSRRVVEADGTRVLVANVDGELLAVEDLCSHDGNPLDGGALEGDRIVCPRHGARFCLRTGRALTPPAYEPIAVFPVRVEDGRVQVRDDRWD